jgi:putative spermidine/putrescine transport system ATP-binding protein
LLTEYGYRWDTSHQARIILHAYEATLSVHAQLSEENHACLSRGAGSGFMRSIKNMSHESAQPVLVDNLSHYYGSMRALDNVNLSVDGGELIALLGPSGCGKTTLLRIIAGFIRQSSGNIIVGGNNLSRLPANMRDIGIVFQNYALFPHMTVAENVAYGLAARGESRLAQSERVSEMLSVVQLSHLADRKPPQLSGGQQQRVALARALAVRPKVLLLDEPFAALDKNLRLDMQIEIKRLQTQFALTAILVTHDQDEAMSVSDRIAVMNEGRIEQLGTPVDIYDRPETLFVNSFIGSSNLLPGVVEQADGSGCLVRVEADTRWHVIAREPFPVGAKVLVSIRPEQLVLGDEGGDGTIPVNVDLSLPMAGTWVHDVVTNEGAAIKVASRRQPGEALSREGQLYCGLAPDARPTIFPQEALET